MVFGGFRQFVVRFQTHSNTGCLTHQVYFGIIALFLPPDWDSIFELEKES